MSLNEVWEAASASPYSPLISKDHQFFVGFSLLLSGKRAMTFLKFDRTNWQFSIGSYWSFRSEYVSFCASKSNWVIAHHCSLNRSLLLEHRNGRGSGVIGIRVSCDSF
jgi:hypothetical protein